ncbi:hypothetical protein F2Q69_00012356 [Brassica cretica]|uniref:CN hydrolase domain-containing protein n=1 Tax=Brassica cretica TaxID=69181 RepID=A0A8S9QUP8_BRACR|nr:hypothetical protein F2Q69_00012356 [Brassica cretica]
MRVCSSGIINNIRCELIKISPEHSTHPAGQVEDGSGTSLQRRVSSIEQVLAAPEEKRSGRGFDGKGGGFWMENLAKELGVVISVNFFEEANNAHYNSIAIIDADGTDLGIYRNSYIPDGPGGYQEKFYSILETLALRYFRQSLQKLDYMLGLGLLTFSFHSHQCLICVPLVASDRIGKEVIETKHGQSQITFYGNSFIAGEIVAEADDNTEAVLVSQFSLEKIKSKRQSWGGVP